MGKTCEMYIVKSLQRAIPCIVMIVIANLPAVAAALSCAGNRELEEPVIGSIAGNGHTGITDGPAATASFVDPWGVAVGPDGAIYVTDVNAHNVRKIVGGVVTTLAGTSPAGRFALQRVGGYQDGPAASARFNRPSGIAVGKDGTVYVADAMNHAIRAIRQGVVSTYVGSSTAGPADGQGAAAQFNYPRGLAIDDDGNLFVGDYGGGVRMVTRDRKVTRLNLPADADGICGISVRGSGKNRIIAYTDHQGIHMVVGDKHTVYNAADESEPNGEDKRVGGSCGQIQILDSGSVLVTDLLQDAVRYVRLPIPGPVGSGVMSRLLVSGRREVSLGVGGFRDGPAADASVDLPRGLALERDGTIVLADAGNRRIRKISNVNPRGVVPADEGGNLQIPPLPKNAYKIVFMANSYGFEEVMWPESMPAQIEAALGNSEVVRGLKGCPYVLPFRLSGAGITDPASLITQYYGDGEADLVVFLVDKGNFDRELARRPDLVSNDRWKTLIPQDLAQFGRSLAKNHTQLLLVWVPDGRSVSPQEVTLKDYYAGAAQLEMMSTEKWSAYSYALAVPRQEAIAASGVRTLKLLDPMVEAEEAPNRVPFYDNIDYHMTAAGSEWVGRAIAGELLRWRPWTTP